jgi:hypothetical protein
LVEHDLAKVGVASSSLVSRSEIKRLSAQLRTAFFVCRMYVELAAAGEINSCPKPHMHQKRNAPVRAFRIVDGVC